ncbi:MarR family winged helix-turn-helix transcriptional regulator [Mycobacterium hubeiense]|uniref:MarR family winged helix-turn-helix transcriptional regulator n=1 Tax=Mycobacterium hubeiense TaxID=1867256 RepID=UPI00115A676B|nr:MarR family winged helix-turn-helix transcriptional regulator [Mycobacterium sp. QGD 101]
MTAQALRAVRDTALEKHGVAFELWVVMEAVAETPDVDREKLIGRLAEMGVHDPTSATNAINLLHDRRLIAATDQDTIGLTPQGQALYEDVIAARGELRNQLYGGIPSVDIATTNRVLDTIRQRTAAVHPAW